MTFSMLGGVCGMALFPLWLHLFGSAKLVVAVGWLLEGGGQCCRYVPDKC